MVNAFLITTYHNRDSRWDYIREEMRHLRSQFRFHVVMATDWKMYRHTTLNQMQYKQMSLTMAYYQACQTAIFKGHDQFVVMEDDVKIINEEFLESLILYPPDGFDLCYLSRTEHNMQSAVTSAVPNNEYFEQVHSNWWETPCTLWSDKFARKFIAHIEAKLEEGLWCGHIDHELMKLNKEGALFYGAKEQAVIGLSNSIQSEISTEGSITDDAREFERNEITKC